MSDSVREPAVLGSNARGPPRYRQRFEQAPAARRETPGDDGFTSGGRPVVDTTGLGDAARRRFGVDTRALAALRECVRDGKNLASVRLEADDERCHRRALLGAFSRGES